MRVRFHSATVAGVRAFVATALLTCLFGMCATWGRAAVSTAVPPHVLSPVLLAAADGAPSATAPAGYATAIDGHGGHGSPAMPQALAAQDGGAGHAGHPPADAAPAQDSHAGHGAAETAQPPAETCTRCPRPPRASWGNPVSRFRRFSRGRALPAIHQPRLPLQALTSVSATSSPRAFCCATSRAAPSTRAP
uniref:ORF2 n=1 Tax=Nitratidesulfovibrio vulgaris TaxID=881 RepID=Q46608_NITVL|nr:ORF2 [Desulfovibrio vulgaris] [Nitratidesulfovibrio vulgaris str. 'Miyazaki F']